MRVPANTFAETVARLESLNADLAVQVEALQAKAAENSSMIASLEPMAEWTEVPDPEPDHTPEEG